MPRVAALARMALAVVEAKRLPNTQARMYIWRLAVAAAVPVASAVQPTTSVPADLAVAVVAVVPQAT